MKPFTHYLVGGAVRDRLLKLPVKDHDWVVVGSTPEAMLAAGYKAVGRDFPVFLHPESGEEYALARTERKQGHGYTGFTCYAGQDVSLEDDLLRRDLTINAMAMTDDGHIIDPYNGQQDLQHKVLRHVSDAFREDPLRVLRVARFYARFSSLGFTIAPETQTLMSEIVASGEMRHLTPERVWQETERALLEETPTAYIKALRQCGALKELFPDIDQLFGVPQPERHHPEIDSGVHTLLTLDQAIPLTRSLPKDQRLAIMWACLTHDLGKGQTATQTLPHHYGHEALSEHLIKSLNAQYRVPNFVGRLALIVGKLHTKCHLAFELKPSTIMRLFEQMDVFRRPDTLKLFSIACEADARGRTGYEERSYHQHDYLQDCFRAANNITAKQVLAERDLRGQALGNEIRARRIRAITAIKSDYVLPDS